MNQDYILFSETRRNFPGNEPKRFYVLQEDTDRPSPIRVESSSLSGLLHKCSNIPCPNFLRTIPAVLDMSAKKEDREPVSLEELKEFRDLYLERMQALGEESYEALLRGDLID